MDNFINGQDLHPFEYLEEISKCLTFVHFVPVPEEVFKTALLAILHEDIEITFRFLDVNQCNHILMLALPKDAYFPLEQTHIIIFIGKDIPASFVIWMTFAATLLW